MKRTNTHSKAIRAHGFVFALALVLSVGLCFESRARLPSFVSPLPPEIVQTLRKHFPGGRVTGFSRERERGVWVFEVQVRKGRQRWEAVLTRDGHLLAISAPVTLQRLPPLIIQQIRSLAPARVLRIEREERHGVIRSGEYRPLDKPSITYEVTYVGRDGRRHERRVRSNGVMELPAPVLTVLRSRFKAFKIDDAEFDKEDGIEVFTVELFGPAKQRVEVVVAANGTILELETPVQVNALPRSIPLQAGRDAAFRRRVKPTVDFRRREVFARIRKGKITPDHHVTFYVTLISERKMRQYVFDANGKLLSRSKWEPAPEVETGEEEQGDND